MNKTSTANFVFIFNGDKAVDVVEFDQRMAVTQIGMGIRDPKWCHLKDYAWNHRDIAARLKRVDLTGWDATKIPKSRGSVAQSENSDSEIRRWWRDVLSHKHEWSVWGCWVPTWRLYKDFQASQDCKVHRSGKDPEFTKFVKEFKESCFSSKIETGGDRRTKFTPEALQLLTADELKSYGDKVTYFDLPEESVCRKEFEFKTKSTITITVKQNEQDRTN